MALIAPELIALARIKIDISGRTPVANYEYSNGFDAVEVKGAVPGAAPILIDNDGVVIFLSDPNQPGNPASPPLSPASQGGIKAIFSVVGVSTPTNDLPIAALPYSGLVRFQYGDYSLGATPYANVDPMKALRFQGAVVEGPTVFYVDVSVFKNPMTFYK